MKKFLFLTMLLFLFSCNSIEKKYEEDAFNFVLSESKINFFTEDSVTLKSLKFKKEVPVSTKDELQYTLNALFKISLIYKSIDNNNFYLINNEIDSLTKVYSSMKDTEYNYYNVTFDVVGENKEKEIIYDKVNFYYDKDRNLVTPGSIYKKYSNFF